LRCCEEDVDVEVPVRRRGWSGADAFRKGDVVGCAVWARTPARVGRVTARREGWSEKQRLKEEERA